jgi:RNA polymerase sigma factor (sigma-70 family)
MTLTPTTRSSLLCRLRDHQDHQAWLDFVALYEPVAYRLFRKHGLQDADARELVQELFVIVSKHIDRWNPDRQRGSFRGWLRRVARNLMLNWLKHKERRLIATGGDEFDSLFADLPTSPLPPSAEFDHELRRALFHRAAEKVRVEVQPATWQAFWQTAVLGASIADTATQLGMAAGAVRVAKCRVLARLQAAVKEEDEE